MGGASNAGWRDCEKCVARLLEESTGPCTRMSWRGARKQNNYKRSASLGLVGQICRCRFSIIFRAYGALAFTLSKQYMQILSVSDLRVKSGAVSIDCCPVTAIRATHSRNELLPPSQ